MRLVKLWAAVVIWAGVIFFFSGIPYLKTDLGFDLVLRKAAHIAEFFVFTFLLYRAFSGSFKLKASGLFIYPAACSLLYAISDEVHQLFVLGRCCSSKDVLVDGIGIIGFYVFIKVIKKNASAGQGGRLI